MPQIERAVGETRSTLTMLDSSRI